MSFGRKTLSLVTLVFSIAALSAFAVAQETGETQKEEGQSKVEHKNRKGESFGRGEGRRFHRSKHHRGGLVRGLRRVELNEGQNAQIKSIVEAHKTAQRPYREEMRALRMKFKDGTATESDKTRMQELRFQARESSEQLRNSILSVLTPDQLQKMEQMKEERKQRMEERRLRWMERKQQRKIEPPTKSDN